MPRLLTLLLPLAVLSTPPASADGIDRAMDNLSKSAHRIGEKIHSKKTKKPKSTKQKTDEPQAAGASGK